MMKVKQGKWKAKLEQMGEDRLVKNVYTCDDLHVIYSRFTTLLTNPLFHLSIFICSIFHDTSQACQ